MSQVLDHVIGSIGPASEANAQMARSRVAGVGAPMLEKLAARLAGAQHTPAPRGVHRKIVVAIGDHGVGDPGIAMGADHPTVIAARAIADGSAALCQIARGNAGLASAGTPVPGTLIAGTPIVLVDAGARESSHMPGIAVQLGRGATHDLMREPAMTVVDAVLGLEAGIALAMSLADDGAPSTGPGEVRQALDVLAIGALGVGAEVASAAILGAATKRPVVGLGVDRTEDYAFVRDFVGTVAEGGCSVFIVHARNAWLKGLSPRQNREVPPLRHEWVVQLKCDFPHLVFVVNGGIASIEQIIEQLDRVDGAMVGRAAYHDPWSMATWDVRCLEAPDPAATDRDAVESAMIEYMAREASQHATPWPAIARHMLGLRHGTPGARRWRQVWSDHGLKGLPPHEVGLRAQGALQDGKLLAHAVEEPECQPNNAPTSPQRSSIPTI